MVQLGIDLSEVTTRASLADALAPIARWRARRPLDRAVTTVPVVRIRNALVAAMQEDIEDRSALELADRLANEVAANGASMVLLDVSAAQVVDSFISRVIVDIARVCRLLGAQVTVVGMRPAVAITRRAGSDARRGTHGPDHRRRDDRARGRCGWRRLARLRPCPGRSDVVRRHRVRALAIELGFDLVAQTRIVTATSELARNTHLHGGGGKLTITPVTDGPRRGLRLEFTDDGPGIPDLDPCADRRLEPRGGLGLGLSGTKRLMDELHLESQPEREPALRWCSG